ncbi:hypothetical protein BO94DRAFT_534351 [Aspergillus sclerotioniger CBS 115572]|uniref:Uncharacterized protein n=1 Tax=Aspergillus sclerotioniger CBS 115572 TaxID=1450535 RepID=A0A317WW75_9EURO|nr:hypothetical protein BO94DRAFT_534351 [Aspergillus sclerotioniger CBS 115572]PWY89572.1 hypothetical protein BO94DRAFT_534351 [Aspergillus sclerotioniger CBS 115572]
MSRNWVPALMAIGMGVWTGYYSFQPALRDLQSEKGNGPQTQQSPDQKIAQPSAPSSNGDSSKPAA